MIMMPLTLAGVGEVNTIRRIGGNEETRRFLENLGFVAEKLIQENTPLRLKINNEIVSEQIDYFDDMILSYKKQCPNISDQDLCSHILFDYHKQNDALIRDDMILNRIKYLKNNH